MSNNNAQFNLFYIATKSSKSDPQNATKFLALENRNVGMDGWPKNQTTPLYQICFQTLVIEWNYSPIANIFKKYFIGKGYKCKKLLMLLILDTSQSEEF